MGRTIPSFRILIEIEKLEWLSFRKHLNKEDKKMFNKLFSIPKLYCHSLSNLSKPIIIESIILILLFYNFKILRTIIKTSPIKVRNKDDNTGQNIFENYSLVDKRQLGKAKTEEDNKKDDSNKVIEDWKKFVDCLNNDDKHIFITMIKNCYDNYNKSINANIKEKSQSCLTRTISLFMALILYQQKQINLIKSKQSFFE
ncbi:MAG: hypothetical protein ABJB76_09855 [Candidatus Nitrosocosmicus sp.]